LYVEVDLSSLPPTLLLREAEDFAGFKVVIAALDDTKISPDAVRALPTEAPRGDGWDARLERMLAAAAEHGWIAADGAVRAHVEWRRPGEGAGDAAP
jgi:hypothetical protein